MIEALGFELADISAPVVGGRQMLRLFIYSTDGVTLDNCARVSREVSDLLDTEDLIDTRYNLEVSSLGLDRPLLTPDDFRRRIGERIKVNYRDKEGAKTASGILDESNGSYIKIRMEEKTVIIPVEANPKGRIIL